MTQFLAGAVAVLAVAVAANLLLTFAVIRKLRNAEPATAPAITPGVPRTGAAIGPFTGTDLDGARLTRADLSQGTHSAVFTMSGCEGCKTLLARMADGERPTTDGLTIFVVPTGKDPNGQEVVAQLPAGVRAVVAPMADISTAFGVTQFPTVLELTDGTVTRIGRRLRAELEADAAGAAGPSLVGARR